MEIMLASHAISQWLGAATHNIIVLFVLCFGFSRILKEKKFNFKVERNNKIELINNHQLFYSIWKSEGPFTIRLLVQVYTISASGYSKTIELENNTYLSFYSKENFSKL